MKDTSCGKNCPFVKQGFCNDEKECPNYVETWWQEGKEGEPTLLKDCSPKRMLLQQQLLQCRLEQVQESLCQARNEYNNLAKYLSLLIEASRTIINQNEENKLLKNSGEKNDQDYYLPILDDLLS